MQAEKELKAVRRDLEGARADNVALVERLRYVQGYQARSRTCNGGDSPPIVMQQWLPATARIEAASHARLCRSCQRRYQHPRKP